MLTPFLFFSIAAHRSVSAKYNLLANEVSYVANATEALMRWLEGEISCDCRLPHLKNLSAEN